jgi:MoxR-like ATPase
MKNSLKNQIRTHIAMKNSDSLLNWAVLNLEKGHNLIDDITELKTVKSVVKELNACKKIDPKKFLSNWIPQMFFTIFENKIMGWNKPVNSTAWSEYKDFIDNQLKGLNVSKSTVSAQFDANKIQADLNSQVADVSSQVNSALTVAMELTNKFEKVEQNIVTAKTQLDDGLKQGLADISQAVTPSQSAIDLAVSKTLAPIIKKSSADPVAKKVLTDLAQNTGTFKLVKVRDIFNKDEYTYNYKDELIDFGDNEVQLFNDINSPNFPVADPNYIFQPKVLHQALNCIRKKLPIPVWLSGQKGTGKTSFVEQLANRLGRQFFRINMRENIDEQIIGGRTTDDQDSSKIVFKEGDFLRAVQISGAFVGLDEFSFIRPQLSCLFQPTLETNGNGVRAISVSEECLRVVFSDYVGIFAMDNTTGLGDDSGNYVGVKGQNEALLDRFGKTLLVDYLPFAEEVKLLQKRVAVSKQIAESIVSFAKTSRQKAKDGLLNSPVSLRQLLAWAEGVKDGEPVGLAFESCVLNKFPSDAHSELLAVYEVEIDENDFKKFARGL